MKVQATQLGYYQHIRRKEGAIFDLVAVKGKDKDGNPIVLTPEEQFSKKWMMKFEDEKPVAKQAIVEDDFEVSAKPKKK